MTSAQQIIQDKSTTVVAAAAATSPAWLPWLKTVSEIAALLLPVLGVCWLLIQFGAWLYKQQKQR